MSLLNFPTHAPTISFPKKNKTTPRNIQNKPQSIKKKAKETPSLPTFREAYFPTLNSKQHHRLPLPHPLPNLPLPSVRPTPYQPPRPTSQNTRKLLLPQYEVCIPTSPGEWHTSHTFVVYATRFPILKSSVSNE